MHPAVSAQAPQNASGSNAVDPALATLTGQAAGQPVSGGGFSNAFAGVAAEQLTGGGHAYTGLVAAEQPSSGGLLAGVPSD